MLNKITDRVYYMDYVQQGDRPVLGLVIGDKYSLVIDGGNSKVHAEEFLGYVSKLDIPPLKYLVLTHWHWDHIVGMETMNLINIVSEKSNEKLKWMEKLEWTDSAIDERVEKGEEIDFCREHIKIEHPNNDRKFVIPKADIIYKKEIKIDLGSVVVEIKNIPCDHSNDSCIVNIPKEKVVFLGDSLYLDMYNGEWSYSKELFYPLLDELESYEADYYIPAHHPKYSKSEFKEFVVYQKNLGELVQDSTDLNTVEDMFKEKFNRLPDEYELEDLKGYVEGNKKKK